jgi:hypothetical protein
MQQKYKLTQKNMEIVKKFTFQQHSSSAQIYMNLSTKIEMMPSMNRKNANSEVV